MRKLGEMWRQSDDSVNLKRFFKSQDLNMILFVDKKSFSKTISSRSSWISKETISIQRWTKEKTTITKIEKNKQRRQQYW